MRAHQESERRSDAAVGRCPSRPASPDGTRTAFVCDRGSAPRLRVRRMDTGQTAKLSNLEYGPRVSLVFRMANVLPSAVCSRRQNESRQYGFVGRTRQVGRSPQIYDRRVYGFNARRFSNSRFTQSLIIASDGDAPARMPFELRMGLRPTHGDESARFYALLIPNGLRREFRRSKTNSPVGLDPTRKPLTFAKTSRSQILFRSPLRRPRSR